MSEVRAQRDRRLIQRTAALLSEDYPLEQLIERVCDALCSELSAKIAFVALAGEHLRLELQGFVATENGVLADFGPQSTASLAYQSHEANLSHAGYELAVPIIYRDRTLGVLALRASEAQFDEQDLRLVAAIARYLAIAIRNQRFPAFERGSRSPQVAIAVVVATALLLTALLFAFTTVRVAESEHAAAALARGRIGEIVGSFDDYVLDARQLASSAAALAGPVRRDRVRVESTLVALLRSARTTSIYGIGVWYEPYRFDGVTRWYGPYAHWDAHHRAVITYEWMRPSYDYQRQPWYRLGLSALQHSKFTEPYFDTDHVYVTTARAFGTRARIDGVISVDSIMPTLHQSTHIALPRGNFVAVTSATGKVVVTSENDRITAKELQSHVRAIVGKHPAVFVAAIPYTNWHVTLWERRSLYDADALRFQSMATAAVAVIWLAAMLTIVVAIRSRRQFHRAEVLEEQQLALEREIAERVRAEERLREYAYRDELTGLPNRAFFIGQLAAHLETLRADSDQGFAVLFIDIDRFNLINDSLGHVTGDHLLAEFGRRLGMNSNAGDVLARLGGDEFVLLARLREHGDARRRAASILQSLRHPFTISGLEFFVTVSIGIAMGDERYEAPAEMLRDADVAMYEAKRAGRGTFRVFDRSMHADALEKLALETDLRRAIERGEIYVEYQPLVHIGDGRIAGFEALARWRHPTRGMVPPDVFIKLAEQTGLIVEIDERVIATACAAARGWIDDYQDIFVAVNFSAAHLARVDDLAIVRRALEGSGLPSSALKIEITETAVMESAEKSLALLAGLRELGVPVVIDDFGTGYSSLSHLQSLPVEELKIDRAFVSTMLQNEKSGEIVRAILAISKTLHLGVTAEGVETKEQADRLSRIGVEFAQGAHYGMAVDADMALRLLRTRLKRSVRV